MDDTDFREIERDRDDRLADEAGEASSAGAARRELVAIFRTYDPERIARRATLAEIEDAYLDGLIGPNVRARAAKLRELIEAER